MGDVILLFGSQQGESLCKNGIAGEIANTITGTCMQIRDGALHEPFDQSLLCVRRRNDSLGFNEDEKMKYSTLVNS